MLFLYILLGKIKLKKEQTETLIHDAIQKNYKVFYALKQKQKTSTTILWALESYCEKTYDTWRHSFDFSSVTREQVFEKSVFSFLWKKRLCHAGYDEKRQIYWVKVGNFREECFASFEKFSDFLDGDLAGMNLLKADLSDIDWKKNLAYYCYCSSVYSSYT